MNADTTLSGVREYNEEYPVVLGLCNNRQCVIALNEGGYNCTVIDLEDLLNSLDRRGYLDKYKKN